MPPLPELTVAQYVGYDYLGKKQFFVHYAPNFDRIGRAQHSLFLGNGLLVIGVLLVIIGFGWSGIATGLYMGSVRSPKPA